MTYSVVKVQVKGSRFRGSEITPSLIWTKGVKMHTQNRPFFKNFLKKFFQTKKPPIFLEIEVNRRRVEIFIILMYNGESRVRQI